MSVDSITRYVFAFHRIPVKFYPYYDSVGKALELNLFSYSGNDPVNYLDPLGLSKNEVIEKGSYRFIRYAGDLMHGGEHWHVFARRTGELLGRVGLEGELLTGSVPMTAMKLLAKLGKITVGVGILLDLMIDPAEAGVGSDVIPASYYKQKTCP